MTTKCCETCKHYCSDQCAIGASKGCYHNNFKYWEPCVEPDIIDKMEDLAEEEALQPATESIWFSTEIATEMAKLKQGTKHDDGKLRLDLIPPEIIEMLGEIFQYGASLYGKNNWEKGFDEDRLIAAALRHYVAWAKGSRYDGVSGLPHLAHAAWSLLIIETFKRRENK